MLDAPKIYQSKNCGEFQIIKELDRRKVLVRFIATGYERTARKDHALRGAIKDMLSPAVFGVGFVGVGKYKSSHEGKATKAYSIWKSMLTRCYCDRYQAKFPTYKGCTVHEEWLNFQNFAEWFEDNYIEGYHLDKDVKIKGNKVYSAESCMFVSLAENNIEAQAKNYKFISPCGEVIEIYNLAKFCRENNLNNKNMSMVHRGKRNHHKGWRKDKHFFGAQGVALEYEK